MHTTGFKGAKVDTVQQSVWLARCLLVCGTVRVRIEIQRGFYLWHEPSRYVGLGCTRRHTERLRLVIPSRRDPIKYMPILAEYNAYFDERKGMKSCLYTKYAWPCLGDHTGRSILCHSPVE